MPRFPGFIGGSNTSQALVADAERTVNLYVESTQSKSAKTPSALMPAPGFSRWSNVADLGGRGAIVANGRLFVVIGAALWEFLSTGVATRRGFVAQDQNPAQMIWNGVVGGQLGICSGGNVYKYDLATNVLSGALLVGGYTHLSYVKGYGLALNPTTGKVNLSNLGDLGTWSAGTFFQRSNFADAWQAMWADANALVWLVGTETFEVWSLSNPASTQPFAPLSGLSGRSGIAAPFAYGVSSAGNYWLQRNPEGGASIVTSSGSSPAMVSTYAVNNAIASYLRSAGRISDAECLVYFDRGHTFFNFTFPSAGATWTLDAETRGWAERGQWNSAAGSYGVWAPRVHADCFGKHLVADRATGMVWDMSDVFATDVDGNGIRRLRRTPGVTEEHHRTPLDQLEILMDVGVAGQGADPQAMLRISNDGGRSWSNERIASYGRIGEYRKRVYWSRLGAPADAVIEVAWSDTTPVRVIDCWVNNAETVR